MKSDGNLLSCLVCQDYFNYAVAYTDVSCAMAGKMAVWQQNKSEVRGIIVLNFGGYSISVFLVLFIS